MTARLSDMLAVMVDSGATPEMLLDAVRKVEAREDERREEQRAQARIRKARQRAKERENVTRDMRDISTTEIQDIENTEETSRVTSVTTVTSRDTSTDKHPPSSPPKKSPQTPKKYTPPISPQNPAECAPASEPERLPGYLPKNWAPPPSLRSLAMDELNFTPEEFDDAVSDFNSYWRDQETRKLKSGRKSDWDGTFRNRLRELAKRWGTTYRKPGMAGARSQPSGGRGGNGGVVSVLRGRVEGRRAEADPGRDAWVDGPSENGHAQGDIFA